MKRTDWQLVEGWANEIVRHVDRLNGDVEDELDGLDRQDEIMGLARAIQDKAYERNEEDREVEKKLKPGPRKAGTRGVFLKPGWG
jgi:hypothetical protein